MNCLAAGLARGCMANAVSGTVDREGDGSIC